MRHFSQQIIKSIEQFLGQSLSDCSLDLADPPNPQLGDLALACFPISKLLKSSPVEVCSRLAAENWDLDWIDEVTATGPYLNFRVNRNRFADQVMKLIDHSGEEWGTTQSGSGKTVIVEYSSPNIAKHLAVHHLRSTMLGQAMANIFDSAGYDVVRWNHLGDWGTGFGKLLAAWDHYRQVDDLDSPKLSDREDPVSDLNRLYVQFSNDAKDNPELDDLARVSINKSKAVYVEVPDETGLATAAGLEQGYVTVPSELRFLLLFTFLKKNKKKKVMVFFSSCNSVKFHAELLNYIDVPVLDIHGRQKQQKRTTTFFQFCKADTGILLCTDVAARGLDIPKVDWIIQFDPPDDPKEYIHRVGRTARGATASGSALLFLTPEETGFLRYLKAARVTLNEYEFPTKKIANVQSQLQRLVERNYYLNRAARDAYRSYLLAYTSHSLRDIFNVHELDLRSVALAFGFSSPPRVDVSFAVKGERRHNGQKLKGGGANSKGASNGHKFSASNPYGKREKSDRRQFSH